MYSWYSSWLPGLPSIDFALPSAIQRRFFSFLLKKLLGHLLKPGQLDINQVESQIGSGFVQVRDLELDSEAINATLSVLPIELHDGSISSVTAHIPWPNLVTSTLGLSLRSLHLTFHLLPKSSHSHVSQSLPLADSVVSVAESFVHELTSQEEDALRESLHLDPSSHDVRNVPGGIDPFLSDHEGEDFDPDGVSIFASLIETLLARVEFDAVDTKITLVHPGHASFTIFVPEVRFSTGGRDPAHLTDRCNDLASEMQTGQTRTVSISGATISARNLRQPIVPPRYTPSTVSTFSHSRSHRRGESSNDCYPGSPAPSHSSLDTNAEFLMSQSLASLPPRPSSAQSVESSMYQSTMETSMYHSAVSTTQSDGEPILPNHDGTSERSQRKSRSPSPFGSKGNSPQSGHVPDPRSESRRDASEDEGDEDETIISFGTDPIIIRLTPCTIHSTSAGPPPSSLPTSSKQSAGHDAQPIHRDKLQLNITVGLIACAHRAWHIHSVLHVLDTFIVQQPSPSLSTPPESLPKLTVGLEVRGVVVLLFPPSSRVVQWSSKAIANYFFRPLFPPHLPHGYVRLHLETLEAEFLLGRAIPPSGSTNASTSAGNATTIVSLSLRELSVFAFDIHLSDTGVAQVVASPVLITDQHLTMQYPRTHAAPVPNEPKSDHPLLPEFDVIDWTAETHRTSFMKPSQWRTKLKSEKLSAQPVAAIRIEAKRDHSKDKGTVEGVAVHIIPMHFFVDLGMVLNVDNGWLPFIAEIMQLTSGDGSSPEAMEVIDSKVYGDEEVEQTSAATLYTHRFDGMERERERRRLENLVLQDLDLDLDYRPRQSLTGTAPADEFRLKKSTQKCRSPPKEKQINITVYLSMVRVQVRCPSPSLPRRSGAFVVDIHDVCLSTIPDVPATPLPRFSDTFEPSRPYGGENVLLTVECRRVVVACSLAMDSKAMAVLSAGPLVHSESVPTVENFGRVDPGRTSLAPPLNCRLAVTKSRPSCHPPRSTLALCIDIPSVHANVPKPHLDCLQYWADDITELVGGALSGESDTEPGGSRDTSLIGSRFFAKSPRSKSSGSGSGFIVKNGSENDIVIKAAMSEVVIRLVVPHSAQGCGSSRLVDINALDLDALIELKSEKKDQTVLTLGMMDLNIAEISSIGMTSLLSPTTPRSLLSDSKPLIKLRFTSLAVPDTTAKESRIKLSLWGFTCNVFPDQTLITDISSFFKAPPGAFESVIPSERTRVSLKIMDGSLRVQAPTHPSAAVFYLGGLDFNTDLVGDSLETSFHLFVPTLSVLLLDNIHESDRVTYSTTSRGPAFWTAIGYVLLADVSDFDLDFKMSTVVKVLDCRVILNQLGLRLHLCADTISVFSGFIGDVISIFQSPDDQVPKPKRRPSTISSQPASRRGIMGSVDEYAFNRAPEIGPAPDMIADDLPTNLDYLDDSFGAAAGLREFRDDDLDQFDLEDTAELSPTSGGPKSGVISSVGGETIKMLRPDGIRVVEYHFDTLPTESDTGASRLGETSLRVRVRGCDVTLFLYDGYDWATTRKTIEDEVKDMRRRLAKIRQLIAGGHTQDPNPEEMGTLLFNSVYVGIEQDVDELEPGALITAIDEELNDDIDTVTQTSWQSLRPTSGGNTRPKSTRVKGKRLTRSRNPSIELKLMGVVAEIDQFRPDEALVSRTFATVKDVEILDHIKTSTWKKFLTELRTDSKGDVRETESNMVRIELCRVHPVPGHPSEEARLRAKILPLRLYVDQDALDFLKKFFSFKGPQTRADPIADSADSEIFFQLAEVFPIDIKLDYKPRRVDYRALRAGRTIELMNFFHFDGAEMTLRHITLAGVSGWPRLFDMLNDLWTPDVKATQLVDVISGVSPIRSLVNVGSGVADLVLLPIAQYKKDGRIVRGMQRGTTAFVKSAGMEAIRLGARLATGTQVILEQADGVLGGQFTHPIATEALQVPPSMDEFATRGLDLSDHDEDTADLISKYAEQPVDVREGIQSAYKSLQRNFHSAAQTILAVPMEVYERSGHEEPVRSVIRAVPIAVLKPMIGASEAVSKTLMGLHNSLDPNIRYDNEAKYKHR